MSGYTYILRKEPYVKKLQDGQEVQVEDRALFKHKKYDRYYRSKYYKECKTQPYDSVELYKATNLNDAMMMAARLHEDSGEWFDIYRSDGKKYYLNYNEGDNK